MRLASADLGYFVSMLRRHRVHGLEHSPKQSTVDEIECSRMLARARDDEFGRQTPSKSHSARNGFNSLRCLETERDPNWCFLKKLEIRTNHRVKAFLQQLKRLHICIDKGVADADLVRFILHSKCQ
jgi:hypothetical protein